MNVIRQPLAPDFIQSKRTNAPILWIASNCNAWNNRHLYIQELMKYINVDSYGHCLNNKPSPSSEEERADLLRQYKFYLAVENSNCDDYVTEKLFDTFMASTVPIVDGPNHYEPYLPNNRSVIRMDAYPDPRKLADYINYLDKNDTAYLEYIAPFRDQTVPEQERLDVDFYAQWGDRTKFDLTSAWCGVCHGILPWWQALHNTSMDFQQDQMNYLRADTSCSPAGKWDYITYGPPYLPHWRPSLPDEFTRPNHPNHRKLAPYSIRSLHTYGMDDSSKMTWMIFSFYCSLFTGFLCFLLYRKRTRPSPFP
ncbi:uncharacterized protein BX664DRAFT_258094 [Halteromyces radiatus]|uniref:uncharacterized protein n=1 Tax=Halteromyces radiatus TaxID=101107 RepID=UPI00221E7158|nr:uncharacterized protein BX664DRAFT_258094 [Halteromyces radiatus]KAI8097198.1 hypothetical protein BX664DRAFT_258094 [Halteromyces radiatus]